MQNFEISLELIKSFNDIVNEKTSSFNNNFKEDKNKIINEIKNLDLFIYSMNLEVDDLISKLDIIDLAIDENINKKNIFAE